MTKQFTVALEEDPTTGELILPLPQEMMQEADIQIGDEVQWIDNKDGSWSIVKKPETEYVLVEAISMMRMRYVVEVPKGNAEWALDSVTCEDVCEFSQSHLGEHISSHRVLTRQEVLDTCEADNPYLSSWTDEEKIGRLTSKIDDRGQIVRGENENK